MSTPTNFPSYQQYQPEPSYQPTPEQLERNDALRQFNRLFVYAPLALAAVLVVAILVWFLWNALWVGAAETRIFASALADVVIMMSLCPLMLLCATVPAGAIALAVRQRQNADQPTGRPENVGRLQLLLWKLERLLIRVELKVDSWTDRIASPVIEGNAWIAYVQTLITRLDHHLRRFLQRLRQR